VNKNSGWLKTCQTQSRKLKESLRIKLYHISGRYRPVESEKYIDPDIPAEDIFESDLDPVRTEWGHRSRLDRNTTARAPMNQDLAQVTVTALADSIQPHLATG
jgi:hypothetical protein